MKVIAIHLSTTNDTNGNARRVFMLVDAATGDVTDIVDEGHMGSGALHDFESKYEILRGPEVEVTPAAYRDFKRSRYFRPS